MTIAMIITVRRTKALSDKRELRPARTALRVEALNNETTYTRHPIMKR